MKSDSSDTPEGITPSERYLSHLCKATFLSLWSYPNVFRDQGRRGLHGDGKEICDLLVIFDKHIICFSDKWCEFSRHEPVELAWTRWYKRAVSDSVKQLQGAKRWIQKHPDRVYIDPSCSVPLGIELPRGDDVRIHLVAVANGASDACREFWDDARGTLMLSSDEPPPKYSRDGKFSGTPFCIGNPGADGEVVHVLDEVALDIVLNELDTVSDFVSYLSAKESIFLSGKHVSAAGEEELLGWYIQQRYKGPDHAFDQFHDFTGCMIDVGFWDSLVESEQYAAKKTRDRVSYAIDGVIEDFARHLQRGTLETGGGVQEIEPSLRILASLTRFERRFIAEQMIEVLEKSEGENRILTRTQFPNKVGSPNFGVVLMAMPYGAVPAGIDYREARGAYLTTYVQVAAANNRECDVVIGLATEAGLSGPKSHDLVTIRPSDITDEHAGDIRGLQEKLGIYDQKRMRPVRRRPLEFPQVGPGYLGKIGRNQPCKCGSGKKYKKCCGF